MLKLRNYKYDVFKTHYWHGADLIGNFGMPKLFQNNFIPSNVISFNQRNSVKNPENYWLDFFIDDSLFERFWNNPKRYIPPLKKFAGVIATDYSMYPELLPAQQMYNCARNRVSAYFLSKEGLNVIPTASWSNEKSFEWCFDGLPENSSIAISSNGCLSNKFSKRMFLLGVDELQKRKNPNTLIVCGRPIKELEQHGNIIYYPNFSQRWKERV